MVIKVASHDSSKMLLAQHDHVIEAFPPDGAHQPLGKRILPRALWCCHDFGGAHISEALAERSP